MTAKNAELCSQPFREIWTKKIEKWKWRITKTASEIGVGWNKSFPSNSRGFWQLWAALAEALLSCDASFDLRFRFFFLNWVKSYEYLFSYLVLNSSSCTAGNAWKDDNPLRLLAGSDVIPPFWRNACTSKRYRVWVMKCTITGGYFTWLRAESVLQNTSQICVRQQSRLFNSHNYKKQTNKQANNLEFRRIK